MAPRGRALVWPCVLTPLVALATGCCLGRPKVDEDLLARKTPAGRKADVAAAYLVHFPDVLAVEIAGHPRWSGPRPVRIDGRIDGCAPGGLRADGRTISEITLALAEQAGVAPEAVRVSVVEYNSQRVFLHGEVKGEPRAVP